MSSEAPLSSIDSSSSPDALQRALIQLNRERMTPALESTSWLDNLERECALRRLEHSFVEGERAAIHARAHAAPREADAFVAWFEALEKTGPGQGDVLFPWLEREASVQDMKWFLAQEMAGEAGFDDLVALAQIKLTARAKLEMARNFWDEMGQGHAMGMHGPMLETLAQELQLNVDSDRTVWESLALANMMGALAANRHYVYQAIGALGVIELTAPGRALQVNAGLKRLGLSGSARRYYALHSTLDVKHADAWKREVLWPLVDEDPRIAPLLAEGALLRLRAGARCFARYRRELWATPRVSSSAGTPQIAKSA